MFYQVRMHAHGNEWVHVIGCRYQVHAHRAGLGMEVSVSCLCLQQQRWNIFSQAVQSSIKEGPGSLCWPSDLYPCLPGGLSGIKAWRLHCLVPYPRGYCSAASFINFN